MLLLAAALTGACKKTDRAFEQLQNIPELELTNEYIYKGSYVVGDTMVMYGRLNPAKTDFRVRIGNGTAPLLGWRHLPHDSLKNAGTLFPAGLDEVKIKITASMGAGEKRPVWITSGGYNIEGLPVDISLTPLDTASFGYDLQVTPYYFLPDQNARLFYCVNGKGTIYLYENGAIKVIRNRRSVTLLNSYSDQFGSFTITKMYAGGVDFHERYLYFSALAEESSPDAATNYIFRFCRYDLESGQLTTLNRTLVPRAREAQTLQSLQPFAGQVGQVKMQAVTGIYPDSSGNVIVNIEQVISYGGLQNPFPNSFTVLANLRSDGTLNYQYKNDNYSMTYYNAGAGGFGATRSIPGVVISNPFWFRISPNEKLLYCNYYVSQVVNGYRVYDLATTDMIRDFIPQNSNNWILEGPFTSLAFRDKFYGYFPMPGKRLLVLADANAGDNAEGQGVVLDFNGRNAYLYAPAVDAGDYFNGAAISSNTGESVLNYDEQGHLYLFTSKEREILKTVKH